MIAPPAPRSSAMYAVVLAGGKSVRMGFEKAIAEICGRKMIEYVLDALRRSDLNFIIATSKRNAPRTRAYCERMRYEIIETPGMGYHEDLRFLQQHFQEFVSVACDIPFLREKHVSALIDAHKMEKRSITGVVPLSMIPHGCEPSHVISAKYVAFGLNVVSSASNDEAILVFDDPLLGINVNTATELKIANDLMRSISARITNDVEV